MEGVVRIFSSFVSDVIVSSLRISVFLSKSYGLLLSCSSIDRFRPEGNKHVLTVRVLFPRYSYTLGVIGVDYTTIIAVSLYTRVDLNLDWSDLSRNRFSVTLRTTEQFLPVRNKSSSFTLTRPRQR